jgi:hypothetical protein
MTSRPTPRLSQSAAWSLQPNSRSPAAKGVSAVLLAAEWGEVVISGSDHRQCEVGLLQARKNSGAAEHASLREDYLNQVQRDFLSRRRSM